jgi:acetyl esterase
MTEAIERFAPAWSRLDPQLAAVIRAIFTRWGDKPPVFELTPGEARNAVSTLQIFWSAGAPAIPHIEEKTIAGASGPIRLRLYDPGVPAPAPTVIFLHGGGWVLCDIDLYDGVARQIATRAGVRCLSVDYGLAPEHPFPVPVHDCVAAVRWAASEGKDFGIDPNRLTLLGDSAGANLALATCLVLRDAGEPLVRGAGLIYGVFSDDFATPSQQANGDGSYLLSTAEMKWYWNYYASEPAARQDPLAAPIRADLKGLPPLYVAAAEYDPLRSDSEELVARLTAIGAPVEFRLWPRMTHACLNLTGWVDAVKPEVDRIGEFLRQVSDSSGVRRPG